MVTWEGRGSGGGGVKVRSYQIVQEISVNGGDGGVRGRMKIMKIYLSA